LAEYNVVQYIGKKMIFQRKTIFDLCLHYNTMHRDCLIYISLTGTLIYCQEDSTDIFLKFTEKEIKV